MSEADEIVLTAELRRIIAEADVSMEQGDLRAAITAFATAWQHPRCTSAVLSSCDALSVGFGLADAQFLAGDFRGAFEALVECHRRFADRETVVGNPFFHLRAGQCKYELADGERRHGRGPGSALDDLARALIGAGVELFDHERPDYLDAITNVLAPPMDFPSWDASRGRYKGSSRDALTCLPAHVLDRMQLLGLVKVFRLDDFYRPPDDDPA